MAKGKKKAYLLGVGMDQDGHFRYTKGENFHLLGGTEDTHGNLQEKAIKINELLKKKSKTLEEVSHKEFKEIAHKVGLTSLEEKIRKDSQKKRDLGF